jgi:hypothetical protein
MAETRIYIVFGRFAQVADSADRQQGVSSQTVNFPCGLGKSLAIEYVFE